MKILFVVNPVSGGSNKDDLNDTITSFSKEHGFEFKLYKTSGDKDNQHIAEHLEQFKPDKVVVGGGDGTIQLVAGTMINAQKNIPLGIIPLGSANGLATSLNLPTDVVAGLNSIVNSRKVKKVDLLKINDKHVCVHLCDIGANALLIKNYEENNERGMMGYARYLIKSIQDSELLNYRIVMPDEVQEKEGYMLAIANAHKYGTGVHISDGSISDGLFEISNIGKITLDAAIKAGLTIFNVFIDKDMFSDVVRATNADIYIRPKAHFQIDGEYMGETDHLKIAIMRSAIQVLMPDET